MLSRAKKGIFVLVMIGEEQSKTFAPTIITRPSNFAEMLRWHRNVSNLIEVRNTHLPLYGVKRGIHYIILEYIQPWQIHTFQ